MDENDLSEFMKRNMRVRPASKIQCSNSEN